MSATTPTGGRVARYVTNGADPAASEQAPRVRSEVVKLTDEFRRYADIYKDDITQKLYRALGRGVPSDGKIPRALVDDLEQAGLSRSRAAGVVDLVGVLDAFAKRGFVYARPEPAVTPVEAIPEPRARRVRLQESATKFEPEPEPAVPSAMSTATGGMMALGQRTAMQAVRLIAWAFVVVVILLVAQLW